MDIEVEMDPLWNLAAAAVLAQENAGLIPQSCCEEHFLEYVDTVYAGMREQLYGKMALSA